MPRSNGAQLAWPAGMSQDGAFWYAQAIGWAMYFLLHYLGASMEHRHAPWWASFASAMAGFVLTSAMRPILKQTWDRGTAQQIAAGLILAVAFSIPFSAVSMQAYWLGEGRGWHSNTIFDYLASGFWCGSILVAWAGVYFGVAYYHESHLQQLKVAQATSEAREARLAMLREQLNPHFLFNTLNGISTLILEGEKERASAMVNQLCSLMRHSIDESPSQLVTLAEELELADLYLQIQQTRFEDRLRLEWNIDPQSRGALVPSMILQPVLENAVRYAVMPNSKGGMISIATTLVDGRLQITVGDTGSSASTYPGGSGIGHRNIRERLSAHYGNRATFDAGPTRSGYRVSIQIPVRRGL